MSRRGRRTPPRCTHCGAAIKFLTITFSRGPVRLPFDAAPLTGGEHGAYPIFGGRAWDINDLTAEMQVMRGVDVEDARDEVFDLPWHRLHRCAKGAYDRELEHAQGGGAE